MVVHFFGKAIPNEVICKFNIVENSLSLSLSYIYIYISITHWYIWLPQYFSFFIILLLKYNLRWFKYFVLTLPINAVLTLFNFLMLGWWRCFKSLLKEGNDQFIPFGQCHDCWWPSDTRSQGISSQAINLVLRKYSNSISTTKSN